MERQIDTTTPNGRLVFGLFATLAEFERELIVERTNAGLAAARARGRMGGRPRKVDTATLKMAAAAMSEIDHILYRVFLTKPIVAAHDMNVWFTSRRRIFEIQRFYS